MAYVTHEFDRVNGCLKGAGGLIRMRSCQKAARCRFKSVSRSAQHISEISKPRFVDLPIASYRSLFRT